MSFWISKMKTILEYIALSTFYSRNMKIWPLVTNFVSSSFCYTNFWANIHTLGRRGDLVRICPPVLSKYKESVLHFVKNGKIFLLQNFNFSSLLHQLYPIDWHSRTLLDGDLFVRLLVFSNTVRCFCSEMFCRNSKWRWVSQSSTFESTTINKQQFESYYSTKFDL